MRSIDNDLCVFSEWKEIIAATNHITERKTIYLFLNVFLGNMQYIGAIKCLLDVMKRLKRCTVNEYIYDKWDTILGGIEDFLIQYDSRSIYAASLVILSLTVMV